MTERALARISKRMDSPSHNLTGSAHKHSALVVLSAYYVRPNFFTYISMVLPTCTSSCAFQ